MPSPSALGFEVFYGSDVQVNKYDSILRVSISVSLLHFTKVCPVCAALPGGDPNHVTDDFAAHLTLEHRAPSRPDMLISFTY